MRTYSARDLCRECEREIAQRRRVYLRLVEQGKMKEDTANRQIEMMVQIRNRFEREAEAEENRGRLL